MFWDAKKWSLVVGCCGIEKYRIPIIGGKNINISLRWKLTTGYHKKNVLQNIIYSSMFAVMTHRVSENKFKRLRPAINLYLTARNMHVRLGN